MCHWTMLIEGSCGPGVYLQQHNLKPGDCIAIKRTYDDLLHIVINPDAPADVREVILPNPVASVEFASGMSPHFGTCCSQLVSIVNIVHDVIARTMWSKCNMGV